MSVVILKWNPGFSSYTMFRFLNDLEKCALANSGDVGMNWSIWDFDKVHVGDICYLLKVGYGQTGIVARGIITSESYRGEDWSWKNRPTRYCDFIFETMINPDAYPLLDSAELSKAIPDFDWNGGHSGVVLSEKQGEELEQLWQNYMMRQSEYFEKASDSNLFHLTKYTGPEAPDYTLRLEEEYNGRNIFIKSKTPDIISSIRIFNYHRMLGKFGVKSWRALQQLLYEKYPSEADLQNLCADLYNYRIEFKVDFYKNEEIEDDDDDDED